MRSIPAKPRALDGCALEDRDHHKSDEVGDIKSDHNICCNAEPFSGEYPQVKEEDGDFREWEATDI